jgi:hypothetical protein
MVDLLKDNAPNRLIKNRPDKLTPIQEEALLSRPGLRFAKRRPDSWYNVSRSTDLGELTAHFDVSYDRANCEIDEISLISTWLNDRVIDERCLPESIVDELYALMLEELDHDPRY